MSKLMRATTAALLAAFLLPAAAFAHWPVVDRYSYISQWYSSSHRALDIAAPRGTRIVPIKSGRVAFAGWRSDGGGYRVIVYHGNGVYSAYYHMSRVAVYKGKWVYGQQTIIGYVGSTGDATGPHVHTEMWRGGYPWSSGAYRVNPWWYVNEGWYFPYRYR